MGSPTLLDRIKLRLAVLLGGHYAAAIRTVERAAGAFAAAFIGRALASPLDIHQVLQVSYWETAAVAGLMAAAALVQGVITTAITGTPSLAGFVSHTVRAQRTIGARVEHVVPRRHTAAKHHVPPRSHL